MTKITRYLSNRVDGKGRSEICLRVTVSAYARFRLKTSVFIPVKNFLDGAIVMPPRGHNQELRDIERNIQDIEDRIIEYCSRRDPCSITRDNLLSIAYGTDTDLLSMYDEHGDTIYNYLVQYIGIRNISPNRQRQYHSTMRVLYRFERYKRATGSRSFVLSIHTVSAYVLKQIEVFYRTEWQIAPSLAKIYESYPPDICPQSRQKPGQRGHNTVIALMRRLRSFFFWLKRQGITTNDPFAAYEWPGPEVYGSPIYITLAERDQLAAYDLSDRPNLAVQRDIFVLQCMIGCRVSDLMRLTHNNIIDGAIEYVASKTSRQTVKTVRVPLTRKALELIDRYAPTVKPTTQSAAKRLQDQPLMPFISPQKYNESIREAMRCAGITRKVMVRNGTTGEMEIKRICDVASSHMARRTFVGNLYKRVKDPDLIGNLSGHTRGSRAFARYRDIDDEIRREVIDFLQ